MVENYKLDLKILVAISLRIVERVQSINFKTLQRNCHNYSQFPIFYMHYFTNYFEFKYKRLILILRMRNI